MFANNLTFNYKVLSIYAYRRALLNYILFIKLKCIIYSIKVKIIKYTETILIFLILYVTKI